MCFLWASGVWGSEREFGALGCFVCVFFLWASGVWGSEREFGALGWVLPPYSNSL